MELRQLRYFVTVADEGGFGRAAERLGIVQSAVSTQVRRLERQLGVTLFDRTARRAVLTGSGEALLPQARAVLDAADRTRALAAELAAGTAGLLRLGAVHGPGERMNRLLRRLAQPAELAQSAEPAPPAKPAQSAELAHPAGPAPPAKPAQSAELAHPAGPAQSGGALRVVLRHLPVAERLRAVRDGELDAAFVRGTLTAPPGTELLPVWHDPLYVAVPAAHPLAALPALSLADPAGLPLRLADRAANAPFHDLVTGALRDAGARPPLGPPFTGLRETLTAIASSATPSWTVFYEVTGLPTLPGIAIRPLTAPPLTTWLALPADPPTPALRRLLAAVTADEPL
ncbi:LysR family transcriptional regulator [Streptomyces sp. NPDC060020]|uniref:LysR family transcriptional regulator n=1 Tax=Streptomyces sp. NPDC060020 TaxID=3347038 RepID=UPI0036CEBB3B